MNKIILSVVTLVTFTFVANAQVGVETTDVGASAILDFPGDGTSTFATKGILLPKTDGTAQAGNVAGTILFDHTADVVKYRDNTGWQDMTEASSTDIDGHDLTTFSELSSEGVKIEDGTVTEALDGVLSLSSSTRALALPKVDGVENLPGPIAGMICFDTSRNSLAIFNGKIWTFWN